MNNMPIVSIVMPTYNVEQYLPAAIESVLNQTFCDWELLIVNDGSTDGSNAVAQVYAQKDERILLLQKDNGGLSDARNFGLSHVRGKYVHFFDSDDVIEPDFYNIMIAAIEKRNDDFVICGYFKDYELSGGSIKSQAFHCDKISTPLPRDVSYNKAVYYYAWNKLFKTDFLKQNRLFFEKGLSVIEDVEFFSRVIDCSPSFRCINYIGYRYQIRNRPTLGNEYSEELIPSQLRGITIQCSLLKKLCDDENILRNDQGYLTLTAVKWMLHCLFHYSNYSFHRKYMKVKDIIDDNNVQLNLNVYRTTDPKERLLTFAVKNKYRLLISIFFSLREFSLKRLLLSRQHVN